MASHSVNNLTRQRLILLFLQEQTIPASAEYIGGILLLSASTVRKYIHRIPYKMVAMLDGKYNLTPKGHEVLDLYLTKLAHNTGIEEVRAALVGRQKNMSPRARAICTGSVFRLLDELRI